MNIFEAFIKLPIPTYIFLGLFVVASVVQLYFAFTLKNKLRKIEKPFCMLFLALAAIFAAPTHPLIYVGAFCGLAGDILLVFPKKKMLVIGTIFFLFGHIAYSIEVFLFLLGGKIIWWVALIYFAACVFSIAISYLFVFTKVARTIEAFGMSVYFTSLLSVLPTMIIAFCNYPTSFMYLGIAGSCIFIASDIILIYSKYVKQFHRHDFYIMFTYLVAELCIIMGFVLTYTSAS